MIKHATTSDMKTLATSLNKLVLDGYTANFSATEKGLFSPEKNKYYQPAEIRIVDFFRFEGASDPADNAILYAIETNDGTKGTLTDAYGSYGDAEVEKLIKEVEHIHKETTPDN